MGSPLGFQYVGDDSNDEVSDPFCILLFFVFNSFDSAICLNDRQDLILVCIVDQQFFFLANSLQLWQV